MPDEDNIGVLLAKLFPQGVSTYFSARMPNSANLFSEE
jgi:hypothetical protein